MRRILVTAIKIAVSATLVSWVLWKVGPSNLAAAVWGMGPAWLALSLALSGVFILARSAKWWMVARAETPGLGFRESLFSVVGGMGLGMVTPARAGEFSRVLFMRSGDRVSLVGLFTVDRILDLLSIVFLGAVAGGLIGFRRSFWLGLAVFALGTATLMGLRPAETRLLALADRLRAGALARRLLATASRLHPAQLVRWTVASLLATAVGYLQFFVLLRSLGDAPFLGACFAFSALILSNLLPVSIAGLGVREGLSAVLLPRFGVSEAAAVNAAFLSYLTNTVLPGIIGVFFYLRVRRGSRAGGGGTP